LLRATILISAVMRVILQRLSDNLFFAGSDVWVPSAGQALDFEESVRATQFIINNKLENVSILLTFDDSRYNINIPPIKIRRPWSI
jgi:hypothetical protein